MKITHWLDPFLSVTGLKKELALVSICWLPSKEAAHIRLRSVGFRSWSRFSAVSLQVMRVIKTPLKLRPYGAIQICLLLLLLLSARPAVTPTTLKRAATNFAAWWTEARWVWTVPKTVTRQRRGCDLNPGPTVPALRQIVVLKSFPLGSVGWLFLTVLICNLKQAKIAPFCAKSRTVLSVTRIGLTVWMLATSCTHFA